MLFSPSSFSRPLLAAACAFLLAAPWSAGTRVPAPQAPASPASATNAAAPTAAHPAAPPAAKPVPKADIRKARQLYEQGLQAERKGDWQKAFTDHSEAVLANPQDRMILLHRELARSQVVMQITVQAEKQILNGQTDAARATLQAALKIDPSYSVARERLAEISDPSTRSAEISLPPDEKSALPLLAPGPVKLRPQPGTRNFDFRGNTRGAYQEIARQFGLTAAFDPDLTDRNIRFIAPGVDFQTAMRLLGEQTGTFFLSADARTFFVAADTPAKRRDFEPEVEQQVQLPDTETPDEMTEVSRMVRDIVGLRRTELNMQTHTLTLRDSLANVALAKALIEQVEQPHAEALLEIEILEVDSTLARNMGITPPTSLNIYPVTASEIAQLTSASTSASSLQSLLGTIFGAQNPLSGSGSAVLPPLVAFGGGAVTFLATLPGISAQLLQATSVVHEAERVLLRVQDGRPAIFFVGEHYPINLALLSESLVTPGTSATQIASIGALASAAFPETDYTVGHSPSGVAVGDFNGDGYPDLAVTNQADNTVSILLGTGTGTFGTPTTFPTGKGPVALLTGDFTGNGILDLAVVDNCTVNPGTGCTASDYAVSILLGNGNGTFQAPVNYTVGTSPVAIVSGSFQNTTTSTLDLAVVNQGSNNVSILLGTGTGTFQSRTNFPVGVAPSAITTADFNNDGYSDLAVTNSGENTFSVLLGNGNGAFGPQTKFTTGNGPAAIGAANFITDGEIGLAVANKTDGTVAIYPGNGSGAFGTPTTYTAGTAPTALVAADVNGDGIPDVTVANEGSDNVSVFLGLGTGVLASPLTLAVETSPVALAVAELVNNGLQDLAVVNQGSDTVSVILNSGLLSSSSATSSGALQLPYPGSQYVDLGLKVQARPRIHPDDEITLDLQFDISSISGQNVNGIPILTNRSIQQTLRLREDQTSVLSGIMSRDESKAITGLPGLAELGPVGYLFGARSIQNSDTELVISITPRQLRLSPHPDLTLYAGRGEGTAPAAAPAVPPAPGAGPGPAPRPGGAPPVPGAAPAGAGAPGTVVPAAPPSAAQPGPVPAPQPAPGEAPAPPAPNAAPPPSQQQ